MGHQLFEDYSRSAAIVGPYRYALYRTWNPDDGVCCWIMLNPSTADGIDDDPTIRRCVGFARAWGCGGIAVVNLFAYRATNPKELYSVADPVGPMNDSFITRAAIGAKIVVAAWGTHGAFQNRGMKVANNLNSIRGDVQCLGVTKDGHPRHPLYVAAHTQLQEIRGIQ